MTVTVLRCIGCGAIETPQPCLGTCVDRRLDLVDGAEHASAQRVLRTLEASLLERRTLLARLASTDDLEPLRSAARAALRTPPPPVPAVVVTAWACDSCGRIEAPQPCIGVCVRPETAMVPAAEHAAVLARAAAVGRELDALAPALRQLAWSTPRAGRRDQSLRAMRAVAAQALSMG